MAINKEKLVKFIKLNMEIWEGYTGKGKGQYDAYETMLMLIQTGALDETTEETN